MSIPMYSLTEETATSMKARMTICRGETFPKTAPKVMRIVAALKSAVMRLKIKRKIYCHFKNNSYQVKKSTAGFK